MSVLTQDEIWKEMKKPHDPLVVTPLLEKSQVGDASIDVRLGHEFIVLRQARVHHVDPTERDDWKTMLHRSQEKMRISLNQPFVLHPGELVLGATLEYVSVPTKLAATVEGRSSWGRLGLFIATASTIAPGFKGVVTLELVNGGGVPLVVYPGVRIAQLILQRTDGSGKYEGKYGCPTGPQFTRVHLDKEMHFWGPRPKTPVHPAPSP
jgi:dCTP deaminase